MSTSGIEYVDEGWPLVTGCAPVSEGCENCYAARLAATRLKHHRWYAGLAEMKHGKPRWTGELRFNEELLDRPFHWRKARKVFVAQTGDFFNAPFGFMGRAFDVMADARCEHHTFIIVTKRIERYREFINWAGECWPGDSPMSVCLEVTGYIPNVWLVVTAENQKRAEERIPELFRCDVAVRGVSLEPLLGRVDLTGFTSRAGARCPACGLKFGHDALVGGTGCRGLDWVILGGESGPEARPMHPNDVRKVRDDCGAAGVAFWFKQWGHFLHKSVAAEQHPEWHRWSGEDYLDVGKKAAGNVLDGKVWEEYPEPRPLRPFDTGVRPYSGCEGEARSGHIV